MDYKEFSNLKNRVIKYVDSLKLPGSICRYKFSKNSDATIFASCFALFIFDLFSQTDGFSAEEKNEWVSYIQSYQNKKTGYFEPEQNYHTDKERSYHQLTCFCLSALGILNSEPKHPLIFLNRWKTPEEIKKYLYEKNCHKGEGGSGNKAMFLGIFLIYEYERTGNKELLDKINKWFEFHDQHLNKSTGFWGNGIGNKYHDGMQNSFHQFVIYTYVRDKKYPQSNIALNRILSLQDKDGFFAKTPGGSGCFEYDAIDYIVNIGLKNKKIDNTIKNVLAKTQKAILALQIDGSFPMMKRTESTWAMVIRNIPSVFKFFDPLSWYQNMKYLIRMQLNKTSQRRTYFSWTSKGCKPYESNLWDTWFRCLTLAQIERVLSDGATQYFKFHKTIGIGYAPVY